MFSLDSICSFVLLLLDAVVGFRIVNVRGSLTVVCGMKVKTDISADKNADDNLLDISSPAI